MSGSGEHFRGGSKGREAWLVWVVALAAGCAGQTDCHDTLTCPGDGTADASASLPTSTDTGSNPSPTGSAPSGSADGGGGGAGPDGEGGAGGFAPVGGGGTNGGSGGAAGAVAGGGGETGEGGAGGAAGSGAVDGEGGSAGAPEIVECLTHAECETSRPRCYQGEETLADNRCVECLVSSDCTGAGGGGRVCYEQQCVGCIGESAGGLVVVSGCAEGTQCKEDPVDPKGNVCIQCSEDADCEGNPEGSVCFNETCVRCALDVPEPPPMGGEAGLSALDAAVSEAGVVEAGSVGAADAGAGSAPESTLSEACAIETPHCWVQPNPKQNVCVQCLQDADCVTQLGAGVCTAEHECIACDATTQTGCSEPNPMCLAGATPQQNACVTCLPGVAGAAAGVDAGCTAELSRCLVEPAAGAEPESYECVECLGDQDCGDALPYCADNECVQCTGNAECEAPGASACRAGVCGACQGDDDCAHLDGLGVCDGGQCVECTVSDESACGDNSCHPETNTCTNTPRGSVDLCESCEADSECEVADSARCVPMQFNGAPRGGYCLRRVSAGCARPYTVLFSAQSLSGAASEQYCGVNQGAVTCEAVLDARASNTCQQDSSCGDGEGGLCRTVGGVANQCTYSCGGIANECFENRTCLNGYCE